MYVMYFLAKFVSSTLVRFAFRYSDYFTKISIITRGICNWVVQIQLAKIQMIRIVYFEWLYRKKVRVGKK